MSNKKENNLELRQHVIQDKELDTDAIDKVTADLEKNRALGGIRPNQTDRENFLKVVEFLKETKRGEKVTLSSAFSEMLNGYIKSVEEDAEVQDRKKIINFGSQIFGVSYHIQKILENFKDIESIAQSEMGKVLENTDVKIASLRREKETLEIKNKELFDKCTTLEDVANNYNAVKDSLNKQIEDLISEKEECNNKIKELMEKNAKILEDKRLADSLISKYKLTEEEYNKNLYSLKEEFKDKESALNTAIRQLKEENAEIASLKKKVEVEKNKNIDLEERLLAKDKIIAELREQTESYKDKESVLNAEIRKIKEENINLSSLKGNAEEEKNKNTELEKELFAKDKIIASLKAEEKEYRESVEARYNNILSLVEKEAEMKYKATVSRMQEEINFLTEKLEKNKVK